MSSKKKSQGRLVSFFRLNFFEIFEIPRKIIQARGNSTDDKLSVSFSSTPASVSNPSIKALIKSLMIPTLQATGYDNSTSVGWLIGEGQIHTHIYGISIYDVSSFKGSYPHTSAFQRPTLWFFKNSRPSLSMDTATTQLATPSALIPRNVLRRDSHPSSPFLAAVYFLLPRNRPKCTCTVYRSLS